MKKKSSANTFVSASELTFFFSGTAVGGLVTFFFDPVRGNYRRALLQDKFFRFFRGTSVYSERKLRDLRNRARGIQAKSQRLLAEKMPIRDDVLEARVRSTFGRYISHPKAIDVIAHDGVVTLTGPVLKSEIKGLLKSVKKVAGVKDVVNDLDVYDSSERISELQGKGPDYLQT